MTSNETPVFRRSLFLNLPVADLERSKAFFTKLGFEIDPRFTNEDAACIIVSELTSVMLLRPDFFRTFTPRAICDTKSSIEGLFAIDVERRADVDAFVDRALEAAPPRPARPPTTASCSRAPSSIRTGTRSSRRPMTGCPSRKTAEQAQLT